MRRQRHIPRAPSRRNIDAQSATDSRATSRSGAGSDAAAKNAGDKTPKKQAGRMSKSGENDGATSAASGSSGSSSPAATRSGSGSANGSSDAAGRDATGKTRENRAGKISPAGENGASSVAPRSNASSDPDSGK